MARSRNIKPGFFENEELADCGPYGMLLFAGLWTLADRQGRLQDRPRRIKAQLFAYFDGVDVERELTRLHEAKFITRYTVDGENYIEIPNFCKHQNPHVKEAASSIPAPDKPSASTVQTGEKPQETVAPDEHSASTVLAPPDSGFPHTDSLIPDSGLPEQRASTPRLKRATAIPEGWLPDEKLLAWASNEGFSELDIGRETRKFVNHFTANGKTMKDWGAAWRNWLIRSGEMRPAGLHVVASNGEPPPDPAMQAWLAVVKHKQTGNGFRVNDAGRVVVPGRILDAAEAVGGIDAIDPGNNFQRKDFLAAYRAAEVAS